MTMLTNRADRNSQTAHVRSVTHKGPNTPIHLRSSSEMSRMRRNSRHEMMHLIKIRQLHIPTLRRPQRTKHDIPRLRLSTDPTRPRLTSQNLLRKPSRLLPRREEDGESRFRVPQMNRLLRRQSIRLLGVEQYPVCTGGERTVLGLPDLFGESGVEARVVQLW